MRALSLPFIPANRHTPSPQARFDAADVDHSRNHRAWVAALLDRHLLERCLLQAGLHDARGIAECWARSACPHGRNPRLLRGAELAVRDFLQRYEAFQGERVQA